MPTDLALLFLLTGSYHARCMTSVAKLNAARYESHTPDPAGHQALTHLVLRLVLALPLARACKSPFRFESLLISSCVVLLRSYISIYSFTYYIFILPRPAQSMTGSRR